MTSVFVSLSTIPPRFDSLNDTLESLLQQDSPPDAVLLWIPRAYRRFPDWDGRLPEVPTGVKICRCETDLGPATKVLPAIHAYHGEDAEIVLCDDDRIYPPDWLSSIRRVAAERPGHCIAVAGGDLPGDIGRPTRPATRQPRINRTSTSELGQALTEIGRLLSGGSATKRSSGFADLLYGFAGALVRPDFFAPDVFDIPPVLWAVDDVWLSGHLERRGIPIWVETAIPRPLPRPDVMALASLLDAEIENHNRDEANRACVDYFRHTYSIWMPSLSERVLSRLRPALRAMAVVIGKLTNGVRRSLGK